MLTQDDARTLYEAADMLENDGHNGPAEDLRDMAPKIADLPEPESVPIPTSVNMARCMVALGAAYLKDHAPDKLAPAPQVGRAALDEFIAKVCLNKPELVANAENAFYWFNKNLTGALYVRTVDDFNERMEKNEMKFIALTTQPPSGRENVDGWRSRTVHIRADAVQAVSVAETGGGCNVQIPAHTNGGWPVKESAEQVLKMISEALK